MTDKQLIERAKEFLMGIDFSIDWIYNSRTLTDDKVIAYEIDGRTDYIKVNELEEMLRRKNTKL